MVIDFVYIENDETINTTIYASLEDFEHLSDCCFDLRDKEEYCEVDSDPCAELEEEIRDMISSLRIPFYIEIKMNDELRKNKILYYDYNKKSISYHLNKTELYYLSGNLKSEIRKWPEKLSLGVEKFMDDEMEEEFKSIERKKRKQAIAKANELKKQ
ncbi:MAG: hypothetical protein GPJ54_02950 [Candidatus Heimdallarchaeota archaeon]|nr:hypothetical protein [Candidatus Heimdallarchaeota archaeon]